MKALIVGSRGQDGRLLKDWLIGQNVEVKGLSRDTFDISKQKSVSELIADFKPDHVYYLAAYHHSSQENIQSELELWEKSKQTHFEWLIYFLEDIRMYSPKTQVFNAASSLLFGSPTEAIQNEDTPFNPTTPYGVTKLAGLMACRSYRTRHNIFACSGILYNHESKLRSPKFVSQKIVKAAVSIQKGSKEKLQLGSLSAEVDWGDAHDYVEAMWQMLQWDIAEDFIIASGVKRTVAEFVKESFGQLGLDWKEHVFENSGLLQRNLKPLVGDSSNLQKKTGWKPKTSFPNMIKAMLEAEGGLIVTNK